MSSSSNQSRLADMTNPPLRKGQIWLPGGNPDSQEAREIVVVGDEEVNYTLPTSGKRQTKQTETIARFALWILRENAQEITVVLVHRPSDILVED